MTGAGDACRYGFLSENAQFAKRCAEEGIVFVGPRPETIQVSACVASQDHLVMCMWTGLCRASLLPVQALGDKTSARELAKQCGVPVVPGSEHATDTAADAHAFAEAAGFPVILKAAMGGGGRGMRVVRKSERLQPLYTQSLQEVATSLEQSAA